MNILEVAGLLFCVLLVATLIWVIGYYLFSEDSDETSFRALGASIFTIVLLIIILIITMANVIKSERKNDEYKKVISEYEADKEAENDSNN